MNVSDYPPLFVAADDASRWGQRWNRRIAAANLSLIVAGSALAYLAAVGGGPWRIVPAMVTAVVLIAGVSTRRIHSALRDDVSWFNGRAVAETVKSLAWRYMMRLPPFDDERADAVFLDALADADDELPDPTRTSVEWQNRPQITARMREVRRLDLAHRRDLYCTDRLADQVAWYSARAAFNGRRARIWSRVSVWAQIAGVIAAVGVMLTPNPWVNIIGIFVAIAAATTAWSQLGRHGELAKSYDLAARELTKITELAQDAGSEADLHDAVRNGEAAISREHTLWIAKRGDVLGVSDRWHPRRLTPASRPSPEFQQQKRHRKRGR
jgi:hypothetical protein